MHFHPSICFLFVALSFSAFLSCEQPNSKVSHKQTPTNLQPTDVLIEYIAHASFKLSHKNHSILLDPFADHVWIGYDFPKGITTDAIFSTHPHYDHDGGLFRGMHPYWEGKIPFNQNPGNYAVGDFKITGIEGRHCDPYGKEFGQTNTIWLIEVAGLRIAHWGDNAPITDSIAAALTDIDVLMVPIDDLNHILKKEELAEVLRRVNPKIIVPMHYKIADLEKRPGQPKALGTIDKYFQDLQNVTFLKGNTYVLNKTTLPEKQGYLVFQHSPKINN